MNDTAVKSAVALLEGWRKPLLVSHAKPDGDAIGSLLALDHLLRARGASPTTMLFEPLPVRFKTLADSALFLVGDAKDPSRFEHVDAVVVVDTCSYSQLDPIAGWLKSTLLPRLVIDHHATRDTLTTNLLIDESAAATCLIIYEMARSAGWPVDATAASHLFVGISTDTGWFRHSNADTRALHAAADLLAKGARAYELFEALYQQDSGGRVRLLGEALSTLELHFRDQVAIMVLRRESFGRAGATLADTEDIVNEPLRIGSAVVSVLLVEQEDGVVRINFRSKAPDPKGRRPVVDVSALAGTFGGGGHRHASGARSKEPLAAVREKILDALRLID